MARDKKRGNSVKKKVLRIVLDNPWETHWPILTYHDEHLVVEQLQRLIPTEGSSKQNIKLPRADLALGINEVTRALEKDTIAAVILATSAKPAHLVQHIVPLCASRSVPVICHRQLNTTIAKMINISSLVTLGIKRNSESVSSPFHDLLLLIQKTVPPLPPHLKNMYSKASVPTITEEETVPPPPKFTQACTEVSKPDTKLDFLSLNVSSVLPLEVPPPELDTLSIKITDPNLELQIKVSASKGVKRKMANKKKSTLVPAKIKYLQSSGKIKKKAK